MLFKDKKLDAIFFYNQNVSGYQKFNGILPYEIKMSMINIEIVKLLGEPKLKAPKDNVIPIWIEYPSKGIQINFTSKSYDDLKNPISSICLFPKKND